MRPCSRIAADGADAPIESPVAISIAHASLDLATFALMIGTFIDEPMTGVERFVDRQLGGLLSTWIELDRYAGELGTSRFVEPAPVGAPATEPPGCYVVGLGRSSDFGRVQLAHAGAATMRRHDSARVGGRLNSATAGATRYTSPSSCTAARSSTSSAAEASILPRL